MNEEFDERLHRSFREAYDELADGEFSSHVMDHVNRYVWRSHILGFVTSLGVLIAGWFFAPEIQSSAVLIAIFPWEAVSPLASERTSVAPTAFLLILGLCFAGNFLINILAKGSTEFH